MKLNFAFGKAAAGSVPPVVVGVLLAKRLIKPDIGEIGGSFRDGGLFSKVMAGDGAGG